MQPYAPISASDSLADGPGVINQNDQAILSCNSGAAFPTSNLQVGMLCYRTDLKQLYELTDTAPTWVLLLDLSTGAANASGLMSGGAAWKVATGQGPAWGAAIPRIASDGGCEIGSYLDFHAVSNDTADHAARLSVSGAALLSSATLQAPGLVIAPASGWANLTFDTPSGQQGSTLYNLAGVTKWQCGLAGDGSWFLWDNVSGANAITATTGALGFGKPVSLVAAQYNGAPNAIGAPVAYASMNGGRNYIGYDLNSQPNLYEARFVNMGGSANAPAGMSGNGYWFGMGAGDVATRGFSLMGTEGSGLWIKAHIAGSWHHLIDDTGGSISGNLSMSSFTVTSDRRLKTDIAPITGHGELIDATNVYAYTKKGRREWGVIAQDLQETAPDLVHEGQDGLLEVDYMSLFAAMLAEVRSLRQRVATLEVDRP